MVVVIAFEAIRHVQYSDRFELILGGERGSGVTGQRSAAVEGDHVEECGVDIEWVGGRLEVAIGAVQIPDDSLAVEPLRILTEVDVAGGFEWAQSRGTSCGRS